MVQTVIPFEDFDNRVIIKTDRGVASMDRRPETPKLPISLVVITKDEQHNISRCLLSAPFVADIVVVDSGSRDKTCEIAKELGARVFVEQWRGYRAQKQRATELASYDWVLSLDADESLSPELASEIIARFASGKPNESGEHADTSGKLTDSSGNLPDNRVANIPAVGFEVPRRSFYMNRWIDHGGWYPDYQVRLFHRKSASWAHGHVHERISANGQTICRLKCDLHHYPFGDLKRQIETNNEYSTLAARDLFDRRVRFSLFKLLVKPKFKFLECYIWKRGFLDGLPGFIIAVGAAYSMFLKWAKLWELERSSHTETNSR